VLHLNWHEENGPPVVAPTRSGFGSRLIEYSAEQSLGGTVELKCCSDAERQQTLSGKKTKQRPARLPGRKS
jgi:two-component sensor histidine kinase